MFQAHLLRACKVINRHAPALVPPGAELMFHLSDPQACLADPARGTDPPLYDGDLTTLSAGLHRFGLSSQSEEARLTNNCVSVALARLLAYSDFREFWQDTLGHHLADTPLQIDATVSLIRKTGWDCEWTIYESCSGNSAFQAMWRDPRFHMHPRRVVAYSSADGSDGHCVVSGAGNIGANHGDFLCYQRDKYGTDLSHEVRAADVIFVFFMRCKHYTPQWCRWYDRQTRRMLERRADPIWIARQREVVESALRALQKGTPNQHAGGGSQVGFWEWTFEISRRLLSFLLPH